MQTPLAYTATLYNILLYDEERNKTKKQFITVRCHIPIVIKYEQQILSEIKEL